MVMSVVSRLFLPLAKDDELSFKICKDLPEKLCALYKSSEFELESQVWVFPTEQSRGIQSAREHCE